MKEYGCTNEDCPNTIEWYEQGDGSGKCPCGSVFIIDPEWLKKEEN